MPRRKLSTATAVNLGFEANSLRLKRRSCQSVCRGETTGRRTTLLTGIGIVLRFQSRGPCDIPKSTRSTSREYRAGKPWRCDACHAQVARNVTLKHASYFGKRKDLLPADSHTKSDRAAAGCSPAPAIRRRQRARPAAAAPRIYIIPPPRRRSIFECLTKSFDVRLSGSPPPVVDRDRARLVADADDAHAHGPRRQQRLQPLGPLDDRDAVAVHHLLQTQVEQLGEALRAVDVHMMHGQPAAVLVHEHEGRTGGAGRDAERADEALHA